MAWIPSAGDDDQMAVEDQREPGTTNMLTLFDAIRQGTNKQSGLSNEATMEEEEDVDDNDEEEGGRNDNDEEEEGEDGDEDDEDINRGNASPGGNDPEQNTMEIKVDSRVYASGDIVSGSVNLNVVYPFLAKGVLVCLHGSEKVHYQSIPSAQSPSSSSSSSQSRRAGSFSTPWDNAGRPVQTPNVNTNSATNTCPSVGTQNTMPEMGYGRICLPFQRVQTLNSLNDIATGSSMSSYQGYSNNNSRNSSNNNSNSSMPNSAATSPYSSAASSSSSAAYTTTSNSSLHGQPRLKESASLSSSSYAQHTSSLPTVPLNTDEKTRSMPYTTPPQQQNQNYNPNLRKDQQKNCSQIREIRGSNDVLKKIEKIHSFEGVYMPGTYTFPFRCALPADLPASCELRGGDWERGTGYSAKTSYKVFGYIEGIIGKKIKGAGKFTVTERLPADTKPPTVVESKEVQSKVALSVCCKLNKAEYVPGERVLLGVTAKSLCKTSTGRVVLSLIHEVTLNTPSSSPQHQQQHSGHHSKHNQSTQQFQQSQHSQQFQQLQQQSQSHQQIQCENDSKKEMVDRIAYSEISRYEMQPIGPYYYGVKWVGFDLPKQLFSLKDAAEATETDQPTISVSSRFGTLFRSRHYIRVHCNVAPGVALRFNLPFNVSVNANFIDASTRGGDIECDMPIDAVDIPRDVTYRGLWQQSEDCSQCNGCGSKLMLWLRKHHCRNCGKIYCNSCSSKKLAIPAKKYMEPVRVCDACYASIIRSRGKRRDAGETIFSTENTQNDCIMFPDDE